MFRQTNALICIGHFIEKQTRGLKNVMELRQGWGTSVVWLMIVESPVHLLVVLTSAASVRFISQFPQLLLFQNKPHT